MLAWFPPPYNNSKHKGAAIGDTITTSACASGTLMGGVNVSSTMGRERVKGRAGQLA